MCVMGEIDKAKNLSEDLEGKVKENIGKVTGDESTEAEGRAEQTKSDLKQAGEKIKDALGH